MAQTRVPANHATLLVPTGTLAPTAPNKWEIWQSGVLIASAETFTVPGEPQFDSWGVYRTTSTGNIAVEVPLLANALLTHNDDTDDYEVRVAAASESDTYDDETLSDPL